VVLGTLRRSSLLEDQKRSSLNAKLAAAVSSGRWQQVNLLEVNDVCDGGPDLLAALRRWDAARQPQPPLEQKRRI